jgi:hypothetical protein
MIIDFDDEHGPMHFEFIYEGFMLGGSLAKDKNLSTLRRELSILEKLESISHVYPCGSKLPTSEPKRALNEKDPTSAPLQIHIDGPEFDMIHNYMSTTPWITGSSVRNAIKTLDWLARCQRTGA